jgi:hypothetical protein
MQHGCLTHAATMPCCTAARACSPTDAAVKAFLQEMGLSLSDLKARPGLAKRIVGSHLLLGSNVRAQVGSAVWKCLCVGVYCCCSVLKKWPCC